MTTPQLIFTVSNILTGIGFIWFGAILAPSAMKQRQNFLLALGVALFVAVAYSRFSRAYVMVDNPSPMNPSFNVLISDSIVTIVLAAYFLTRAMFIRRGAWLRGRLWREWTHDADQVLQVNDDIAKVLVRAKLSHELSDFKTAYEETEMALVNVQKTMTRLLTETGVHRNHEGLTRLR